MTVFGGFFDTTEQSKIQSAAAPWLWSQMGLVRGAKGVTDWMDDPLQFFPGQTYAPQTESERQAIEQMLLGAREYPGIVQNLMGSARPAFESALGAPQQALDMNLQDVMQNPALTGAADAIQSRVMRNLEENILPQLRMDEIRGPAGGVAQGIAARGTSDVLSEQLANMYRQAWGQGLGAETARYTAGLNARQGALGATPMLANLGLSQYLQPASMYEAAGEAERTEDQLGLDEQMARHQFAQMEPYNRAVMGMEALMRPGVAFGTSTREAESRTQPSDFSNLGNIIGLGGMLGGGLFGQQGMFPNVFGGMGGPTNYATSGNRGLMQGWYGMY